MELDAILVAAAVFSLLAAGFTMETRAKVRSITDRLQVVLDEWATRRTDVSNSDLLERVEAVERRTASIHEDVAKKLNQARVAATRAKQDKEAAEQIAAEAGFDADGAPIDAADADEEYYYAQEGPAPYTDEDLETGSFPEAEGGAPTRGGRAASRRSRIAQAKARRRAAG